MIMVLDSKERITGYMEKGFLGGTTLNQINKVVRVLSFNIIRGGS